MKILVVEDDDDAAAFIVDGLRGRGYEIERVADGKLGLEKGKSGDYDVVALDRMLPGLDGIEIVAGMRAAGVATPVLMLTNLSGVDDRVEGLEAGADDYLVKPFAMDELAARVAALARRPTLGSAQTKLTSGDLELDLIARTARRGAQPIELLPREFQLLEYLMRSEGRVVTRKMLLEQVWNFHFDPKTNIVETHISRLRTKIDLGERPGLIRNIRGVGYALRG